MVYRKTIEEMHIGIPKITQVYIFFYGGGLGP